MLSRVLPWASSVLLHALALFLLGWSVMGTIYVDGQEAVQVDLLSFLPGSGGVPRSAGPVREAGQKGETSVSQKSARPPIVPKEKRPEPTKLRQEPAAPASSVLPSSSPPLVDSSERRTTADAGSQADVATSEAQEVTGSSADAGVGIGETGDRLSAVPGGLTDGAATWGGTRSGGGGDGAGGRGIAWRQLLRERIERAKQYPVLARRLGMEGTVKVEFQIARDGGIAWVKVVESSGYPLLDDASVEAIKRAAPLPMVSGRIRIPISYRLSDGE